MKITNKLGLPLPFVDAVTREYQYKDNQYSVTSILKGTCQTLLERRHHDEIEQDVSDMIWLIFGTSVHSILENANETDTQLKENKLVIDIGDYKLSGIFDLYDESTRTVTDYKTATVWKVIYNDWEDYRKQLMMYAYMLRSIGFECDTGEIVALLKDHSKTKAKVDKDYPPYPIHKVQFKFTDEDFKEIEKFIFDKFKEIHDSQQLKDDELTPCNEEERWQDPIKYAVKKKGNKRALKLYEDIELAKKHCATDDKLEIEVRESIPKKCVDYCGVNIFCPFYQNWLKERGETNG